MRIAFSSALLLVFLADDVYLGESNHSLELFGLSSVARLFGMATRQGIMFHCRKRRSQGATRCCFEIEYV